VRGEALNAAGIRETEEGILKLATLSQQGGKVE
jgi:hypothetical protein